MVLEEIETEMTSKVLDDTSSEIIHVIAGILDINALDIHYNDHIELSALYPTFSLLEHSCLPNTHYMIDLQQLDSRKKFRIIVKAAGEYEKFLYQFNENCLIVKVIYLFIIIYL